MSKTDSYPENRVVPPLKGIQGGTRLQPGPALLAEMADLPLPTKVFKQSSISKSQRQLGIVGVKRVDDALPGRSSKAGSHTGQKRM